MEKDFVITRVVTKHFLADFLEGIRNFFGFRLRSYEKMLNQGTNEVLEEMRLKYNKIRWYRLSVNPLTSASAMIVLYGVYER